MTYVKIGEQQIVAEISGLRTDHAWDNRDSKSIRCALTYEEAKDLFADDTEWSIIYQADPYVDEEGNTVTPDPIEYDNREYCVAGDIIDHRSGTVSVKMGKMLPEEILAVLTGEA